MRTGILKRGLITALTLFSSSSFGGDVAAKLTINISNIEAAKGRVMIAIYNKENHWPQQPYKQMVINPASSSADVSFDVPHGEYAISVFQDLNGNNKLDKGLFGIPKEPIGLGNNHRPAGKPAYRSCTVTHGPESKLHEVTLYYVL